MRKSILLTLISLFSLSFTLPSGANEISEEELERWFNDDSMAPPKYTDTNHVNEGDLVFLEQSPKKRLHHHHNTLTIYPESLENGWILLTQCHSNIDKVAAAQIVFDENRIKDIEIVSYKNIEKVWVEGASVQMENVTAEATLCIKANSNSLVKLPDGRYQLKNGPFMRRFLDGYFPIHVTLDLNFVDTNLQLVDYTPKQQTGYNVTKGEDSLSIDTIFEGMLLTEFHFKVN